ncbi:hypothetical protein FRB98_001506 [Tulasnella sp. 332]|nr:hypothetical protein FRB98_001506 [Tulasnella sp. 332]
MVQSHLALAVPDLPPEILEKLSSKDLSNMAQTCKDWTELASERRWRTARTKLSQLLPSLARSLTRVMELNMIATQDRSTHFEENYSHKAAWMELDIAPGLESLCAVAKPYERSGRRLFRRLSHVDATEFTRDLVSQHGDLFTSLLDLIGASELRKSTSKITCALGQEIASKRRYGFEYLESNA